MAARGVRTVIILASERTLYASVVDVIDAAKQAGAETIAFEVDALGSAGGTPN
jgi:biopolymer transport protein ExbD